MVQNIEIRTDWAILHQIAQILSQRVHRFISEFYVYSEHFISSGDRSNPIYEGVVPSDHYKTLERQQPLMGSKEA
jgi:hypothetical protein